MLMGVVVDLQYINIKTNIMKSIIKLRVLFFIIILVGFSYSATSQTFETVKKGGFDASIGVDTGTTMTIDSKVFELSETSKGTLYIKCKSARTGNYYAVWIGQPANVRHEGKAVYRMKSGKYCIYKIGKAGNPYAVYLKEI